MNWNKKLDEQGCKIFAWMFTGMSLVIAGLFLFHTKLVLWAVLSCACLILSSVFAATNTILNRVGGGS